jgi:hypothetical protein
MAKFGHVVTVNMDLNAKKWNFNFFQNNFILIFIKKKTTFFIIHFFCFHFQH